MDNCIFCKIAQGEIPSKKIYEDENVLAFLDINPTSYGHTLVIPKKHAASFLEADEKTLENVFAVAQKIARHLEKELKCDGINVLSNIHEAAGQSVEHFHVHLIPRYADQKEKEAVTIEFAPVKADLDELQAQLSLQ